MPPPPPVAASRQRRRQQRPTRTPSPAAPAARAGGDGHLHTNGRKQQAASAGDGRHPPVNKQPPRAIARRCLPSTLKQERHTPRQHLQVPAANVGGERRPPDKRQSPGDRTDTTLNRSAAAHSRSPPQPAARNTDPRRRQQPRAINADGDRHLPVSHGPPAANASGEGDAPVQQRLLAANARSRPAQPPRRQQRDRSTTVKRRAPTNEARHRSAAPVTCARCACLAGSVPLGH